jgi:hypothetical protein
LGARATVANYNGENRSAIEGIGRGVQDRAAKQQAELVIRLADELNEELNLPATLLIGDQPAAFAEADRLRAESDLRLSTVPPLLALTVFLAASSSLWWLLTIPAVMVLLVQGIRKDLDSRSVIAGAIRVGKVSSRAVQNFEGGVQGLARRAQDEIVELS